MYACLYCMYGKDCIFFLILYNDHKDIPLLIEFVVQGRISWIVSKN